MAVDSNCKWSLLWTCCRFLIFFCWFSTLVKSDKNAEDIDNTEKRFENKYMHHRHHSDPPALENGKFDNLSEDENHFHTNRAAELASGHSLKRRRRFNHHNRYESMAFYRPTKHNSLFFTSSTNQMGERSEPFKESIENKKKAATTTTTSHNNKDEKFPVDRSDFLALRSVEDDKELEEEKSSEENNVVGGVSNIPLFSSSEEKLLAYASEQDGTFTSTILNDIMEENDLLLNDDSSNGFTELINEEDSTDKYESITAGITGDLDTEQEKEGRMKMVSKLLRIVETQAAQGSDCTPGEGLNMGEKVVSRYAQERFHEAALYAVNMANLWTRMWKYAPEVVGTSEYLIHASLVFGVELTEEIFAFGNCYDAEEYKNYFLFCPYAYRLPEGPILAKDLAIEYKYLSNTSEWFFNARKRANSLIEQGKNFKTGYHTYTYNSTAHTTRTTDKILTVKYEDGAWTKPYYDCGGGNIWMMTYTVPFFGFADGKYFFKGTSGIDIDLRRVDINQCPATDEAATAINIFGGTDKCKKETTNCEPISGLGFRRGSYKCVCKTGWYFPNTTIDNRFFNGTDLEEEYSKKYLEGEESSYENPTVFQCLPCADGCDSCEDNTPCIATLNWVLRTILLILQCVIIGCLPVVVLFTYKYKDIKVVRAASPVLLRIIILGAFFIYATTIILYPTPNIVTCTMRIWLREIGFALAYGALMLKTWRISIIFRVKSAKAVKITDMDLIKRLAVIVGIFVLCLLIRTLVSPPVVIVGYTSDDLKAFLCQSDWWDHSFTILEFLFLLWGIRLCIMVRKAPSEFNESRFISMAIYNEFLLSIFLNVSVFFLQQPANPDLLFIIFFCHSQLTISILLCLIFASKFYLVMKGHGKQEDQSMPSKTGGPGKFVNSKIQVSRAHNSVSQASTNVPPPAASSIVAPPISCSTNNANNGSNGGTSAAQDNNTAKPSASSDMDINQELDRIYLMLQDKLKDKQSNKIDSVSLAKKLAIIQNTLNDPTSTTSNNNNLQKDSTTNQKTASDDLKGGAEPTKRSSVTLLNGQIMNCDSAPLNNTPCIPISVTNVTMSTNSIKNTISSSTNSAANNTHHPNAGATNGTKHDSPIIVHQSDKPVSKVSFDLTKGGDDSTTTKLDSCGIVNKDNLVVPNEDILTNISDENRDNFPCSASSGSSCHSSRCCCSSYVCSMCSPRGSLDHGIFPPDSGSSIGVNSVDITSPRIHSKSVLLQDHVEASTAVDNVQTITNLEQIAHCDNPEDEILLDEETAALHQDYDHDQEIDIASAENEVLINKTEKKNNPNKKVKQHENSRSSRAHRILMNLDDKNRFTDEITV